MIDKSDVVGYTNSDAEYSIELWDYVRGYLRFEEATSLIRGERAGNSAEGIEAMERFAFGEFLVGDQRPPTNSMSNYQSVIEQRLTSMSPRMALQAWQGELELAKSGMSTTESKVHSILAVLRAGEEVFDVDLSDEIVSWAESLPESETKLDTLEVRDEIGGEEWYQRTEAL